MSDAASSALERAVELSRELAVAAERGDSVAVVALDHERRRLLQSIEVEGQALSPHGRHMMQEVASLNNLSIGKMEHHRRIMQRRLDGVGTGRRALTAYSASRQYR